MVYGRFFIDVSIVFFYGVYKAMKLMLGEIPHQWPASKWSPAWTDANIIGCRWETQLQCHQQQCVLVPGVHGVSWWFGTFFSYAWYSWTCVPMVRCFIFGLIIQTYTSDDVDDYGEEEEEGKEKREGHAIAKPMIITKLKLLTQQLSWKNGNTLW